MRSLLSLIGITFLLFHPSFAQQGFTLQVAAYSTLVPPDHFGALLLPIQRIAGKLPTGEAFFRVASPINPNGYSVQLAAFSTPAPLRHFVGMGLPIRQVACPIASGDTCYLYVIDGFETYAEADKVRKVVVANGFTEAIATRTIYSRKPAIRTLPYKGNKEGAPVPEAEKLPENQPVSIGVPGER